MSWSFGYNVLDCTLNTLVIFLPVFIRVKCGRRPRLLYKVSHFLEVNCVIVCPSVKSICDGLVLKNDGDSPPPESEP